MDTEGLRAVLIAQAWQLAVAVLLVAIVVRLAARNRPHLAHALWLVVLLKCITPPVVGSPTGVFCWAQQGWQSVRRAPADIVAPLDATRVLPPTRPTTREASPLDAVTRDVRFTTGIESGETGALGLSAVDRGRRPQLATVLVDVWLAGAVLALLWTVARVARCWWQMRSAGLACHAELDAVLESARQRLGVRQRVRLLVTAARIGPAVMGIFRPTIVLPRVLVEARSTRELEPILAHELAHVRRGDLWVSLLQLGVAVAWWFHPLVWRASRVLSREAERCCDEEVMAAMCYSPREYARSLLAVLEWKRDLAAVPAVPGMRPVEITSQRLERIMRLGHGGYRRTPWWCWLAMIAVVALLLPGAARVAGTESEEPTTKATVKAPPQEEPTAEPDAKRRRLRENLAEHERRAEATRENYEAIKRKYDAGEAPIDVLLDAMRRNSDAEVLASYARLEANAKLSQAELRRQLAFIRLDSLCRARDESLAVWRGAYERYRDGAEGADAEVERQSREQYFHFRKQVEEAITDTQQASGNDPLVVRMYSVVDLIVPRPNLVRSDAQQLPQAQEVEMTEEMIEPLIEYIRSTIAPHSWTNDDGDGLATIEPIVKQGSLAIAQTEEAHRQIHFLLSQMRSFQEGAVNYRVRPLRASLAELQAQGIEAVTPLTDAQLETLGGSELPEEQSETLGRLTVFNGQTANIKFKDSEGAGGSIMLQNALAPRFDFMQLWIAGEATGEGGQIVRVNTERQRGLVIAARTDDGREVAALVTWWVMKPRPGFSMRVGFER